MTPVQLLAAGALGAIGFASTCFLIVIVLVRWEQHEENVKARKLMDLERAYRGPAYRGRRAAR